MPTLKISAVIGATAAGLLLAGCSSDDLFSNMNGTRAANSSPPAASDRQPSAGDAPPDHPDNNEVRRPRAMSRQDEREAGGAAAGIERALDRQRRLGRIGPQDIRPVLEGLAAPDRVTVENRIAGTSSTRMEGSRFGVSVGATACVTGAVDGTRVWTTVGGRHPETGCMEPPPVR